MTLEEINKVLPNDWLSPHWDEFMELSEKMTKTIIISQAIEQKWTKPMKTRADYKAFMQVEAENKELTVEEIHHFLVEAGRLKARNYIFEKYCVPLLPKNESGQCEVPREQLLKFVNNSIKEAGLKLS